MAWSSNSSTIIVPEAQVSATAAPMLPTIFPFNALDYIPAVNNVPVVADEARLQEMAQDAETKEQGQEIEDRAAVRRSFLQILNNKYESGSARVQAGRQLIELWDNKIITRLETELEELRELVKMLMPDPNELPPDLRKVANNVK